MRLEVATLWLATSTLWACSQNASPSPISPTVVSSQPLFFDGATGEALKPSWSVRGLFLEASAEGYLTRIQPLSDRIALWGEEEAYLRALIYTQGMLVRRTSRILVRDGVGMVGLCSVLTDLTTLPCEVGEPANLILQFGTPALAADATTATTYDKTTGVISMTVTTVSRAATGRRNLAVDPLLWHEVGHALGMLGHSVDPLDVMHGPPYGYSRYSPREERVLRMMYRWRKTGNVLPDREGH